MGDPNYSNYAPIDFKVHDRWDYLTDDHECIVHKNKKYCYFCQLHTNIFAYVYKDYALCYKCYKTKGRFKEILQRLREKYNDLSDEEPFIEDSDDYKEC
jgi:hypothetical protein